MRKASALVSCLLLLCQGSLAAPPDSGLKKYLRPATISEMDWILFQAETRLNLQSVGAVSTDTLHVVDSRFSFDEKTQQIKITFLLGESTYTHMAPTERERQLRALLDFASGFIALPEYRQERDLEAEFRLFPALQTVVATFKDGRLEVKGL